MGCPACEGTDIEELDACPICLHDRLVAAEARLEELRELRSRQNQHIDNVLGKALGMVLTEKDKPELIGAKPGDVFTGMDDCVDLAERAAAEIARLRDVMTWINDNCPGKCGVAADKSLDRQVSHDEVVQARFVFGLLCGRARAKMSGQGHTFCDGSHTWNVGDLWAVAAGLPVEDVPLAALDKFQTSISRDVRAKDLASEMRRTLEADLSFPIILSIDGWITDGMHRLTKAHLLGHATIKAVRLTKPLADLVKSPRNG